MGGFNTMQEGGGGGGGWEQGVNQVTLTTSGDVVGFGVAPTEKITMDGNLAIKSQGSAPSGAAGYSKLTALEYGNDANTVLLLHCDGSDDGTTFTDDSTGGDNDGTAAGGSGTAVTKTGTKKFGTASGYLVASSTHKVSLGTNVTDFEFGAGDFTVECWFKTSAGGSGGYSNPLIANGYTAAATSNWKVYCGEFINAYLFSGGTGHVVTATTATDDDAWHHVAFVRNGPWIKLFIDGRHRS